MATKKVEEEKINEEIIVITKKIDADHIEITYPDGKTEIRLV